MNARERAETIARYDARLDEFGETEQALGWGPKGRSRLRYEILLSRWDLSGATVIDFGCGFGDLYSAIVAKNWNVDYIGVDLNSRLLDVASKRYPGVRFELGDLSVLDSLAPVDYVLTSGVFNHLLADNRAFVTQAFERFDGVARRGFSSNFLSSYVDFPLDHTYHSKPEEILALAYRFSRNVVLRNDYMPFEFTVFVDKAAGVDSRLTVYEDYVRYV